MGNRKKYISERKPAVPARAILDEFVRRAVLKELPLATVISDENASRPLYIITATFDGDTTFEPLVSKLGPTLSGIFRQYHFQTFKTGATYCGEPLDVPQGKTLIRGELDLNSKQPTAENAVGYIRSQHPKEIKSIEDELRSRNAVAAAANSR